MRSSFNLLAAFATALFATVGCSGMGTQFKKAPEPTSGDRARLRVVADQTMVKLVPGKDCVDLSAPGSGVVLSGGLGSHGYASRSLGMPSPEKDHRFAEFYVEAGKPLTVLFLRVDDKDAMQIACSISLTFVPEVDKDYEATLRVEKVSRREKVCIAAMHSLADPPEKVQYTRASDCK